MAKRRNAKKEKAARNKINARRFRKQSSRYSSRGRRHYNNGKTQETTEEKNTSEATTVS